MKGAAESSTRVLCALNDVCQQHCGIALRWRSSTAGAASQQWCQDLLRCRGHMAGGLCSVFVLLLSTQGLQAAQGLCRQVSVVVNPSQRLQRWALHTMIAL
jgi:hypothetical protein